MEREMPALPHFSLAPFKELCLQSCSFLTAACSTTRYKTFRAHHFWNSPACEELPWNVSTVNCLSTGKQLNPPHTVLLFELTRLQNLQPQSSVLWHQKPGEMIWFSHWFVSSTVPCMFHACREIISASFPVGQLEFSGIFYSFSKERSSVLFFMDYKTLL